MNFQLSGCRMQLEKRGGGWRWWGVPRELVTTKLNELVNETKSQVGHAEEPQRGHTSERWG